jgi:hypothetical protein
MRRPFEPTYILTVSLVQDDNRLSRLLRDAVAHFPAVTASASASPAKTPASAPRGMSSGRLSGAARLQP